jgi:hypothetical protein
MLKEPKKRAEELKEAIGQVIQEQRLPSGTAFHYAAEDKITGPVSAADLQHLVRDRIIDSDTPIYSVELREWKPLRDVFVITPPPTTGDAINRWPRAMNCF